LAIDHDKVKHAVRLIFEAIGEDPDREGLADTPRRIAEMFKEIFSGVGKDPRKELNTFFTERHEELVALRDIPFYSMCEHHLLPFFGRGHIGYLPADGRVVGVSKLARVLEVVARRPQIQERMGEEIADAIVDVLAPRGVIVVLEAEHLCMVMRGVKKPGSQMVTITTRGVFREDPTLREEALQLLLGNHRR